MNEEERCSPVAPRPANDSLSCCVCFGYLDPVDAFAFSGSFACEPCVRHYYGSHSEADIQLELRERRAQALRQLGSKRTRNASLSKERLCGQCGHVAGTNKDCEECQ